MRKALVWKITAICISICIVLGVAVGVHCFNYSEEDYKIAKDYLDEINLIYDGLSNRDVINVYNDIVSDTLKNPKTEKIIRNSTEKVLGYEISETYLPKKEMLSLISRLIKSCRTDKWLNNRYDDGTCSYGIESIYEYDENGEHNLVGYRMCKYDGQDLIWEIRLDISNRNYWHCAHVPGGFIVYDSITRTYGEDESSFVANTAIMNITYDGDVVWNTSVYEILNQNGCLRVKNVYGYEDGSYDIFIGDYKSNHRDHFYIIHIDTDGNKNIHHFIGYSLYDYIKYIPLSGGGYIFLNEKIDSCILMINKDMSSVTELWTKAYCQMMQWNTDMTENAKCIDFDMGGVEYKIEDAASMGNKLYLSLSVIPSDKYKNDKEFYYGTILQKIDKGETDGKIVPMVLNFIKKHDRTCEICKNVSDDNKPKGEKLYCNTSLRTQHIIEYIIKLTNSARLVEFDLETLKITNVYNVDEAFAGALSVKDGNTLCWDVEADIYVDIYFPYYSGLSPVWSSNRINEYRFTDEFKFISKEKTFRWDGRNL